jgi:transposase
MRRGIGPAPAEVRIGACADYILGRSMHDIEKRWGVTISTVSKWIKRTGSFKLRRKLKGR